MRKSKENNEVISQAPFIMMHMDFYKAARDRILTTKSCKGSGTSLGSFRGGGEFKKQTNKP